MSKLEAVINGSRKQGMLDYLNDNPHEIDNLIKLALEPKGQNNWRATWLLPNFMSKNDERIIPFLDSFIERLADADESQQRDTITLLLKMEFNEDQEGVLLDTAINIWTKIDKIPSVRYRAFELILKIAKNYPELSDEIKLLSEEHYMESLSPGIQNSLRKKIGLFLVN